MINIIWRKIKDQYKGVAYYALGLLAYTWLMIGMFPSMQNFDIEKMMQQLPPEMSQFFGGEAGMQYNKIEGFLSIEYLSIFFVIIIGFFLASSVGSAIAGNIETKIAPFDLSQPISRTKYVLSQISVSAFFTLVLVWLNTLIIKILCLAYKVNISNSGLIKFAIVASFFMLAFIGIASFLSSVSKTKLSVTLITVAFALGSYVFLSLSNIVDKLKDFEKLSIYFLYQPQKLLENGNININHILILAGIFIIGLISSLIIFNKKDL